MVYYGHYYEGLKHGFGKIFNSDGSLAYEGMMSKGLPHGHGKILIEGKMM